MNRNFWKVKYSADRHGRRDILWKANSGKSCPGRSRSPFHLTICQGSLTVEACFAVPLFFFCMILLICLMDMYGLVASQTVKLQQLAETAGVVSGGIETENIKVIDIKMPVFYHPTCLWFPGHGAVIACRGRVYPWIGREPEKEPSEEKESERMVYVTATGSVYHTHADCTHLKLSVTAVSGSAVDDRRNSGGGKYHACEKCVRNQGKSAIVYITKEGNRYHNSSACSGLKRDVRLMPYSEVKGKRECSRCRAED